MYCINCGNRNDGNNFCVNCGMNLKIKKTKEDSGLKIFSIILGALGIGVSLTFIFSFIGFILSLIGLILAIIAKKKEKNIIGIILNSVGLILSILIIIFWILIFRFAFSISDRDIDRYDDNYYNNGYYEKFNDIIDIY